MGFKKQEEKKAEVKTKYTAKVTKVRTVEGNDNVVFFNMNVNGIDISDCKYIFYTNADGQPGEMISFPSREYEKDGAKKYSNYCWFPINKDLRQDIHDQIESLIG